MRSRDFRRHQADRHMWRRLKEDRNQHYTDLTCPCWTDPAAMARFREQPKRCSRPVCCGNPRRLGDLTMQERRAASIEVIEVEGWDAAIRLRSVRVAHARSSDKAEKLSFKNQREAAEFVRRVYNENGAPNAKLRQLYARGVALRRQTAAE